MDQLSITKTQQGFFIEGYPEAVRVVRVGGKNGRCLEDLTLHRVDLEFALECLSAINEVGAQPYVLRESLWQSAIIHFLKCFGNSASRGRLEYEQIYEEDAGAREPFEFFRSFRNKHLVHDENSYSQGLPGAVLNERGMEDKIAKVICLGFTIGGTLNQENYSNLHLLITRAMEWIVREYDELCDAIASELESKPYDELIDMEAITYTQPEPGDIHKSRLRPKSND